MRRKKLLFFMLFVMPVVAVFAVGNSGNDEKQYAPVKLQKALPSEITYADLSDGADVMSGSLRAGPGGPPPEPGTPVGDGLALLTLCAGFYLLKFKKH